MLTALASRGPLPRMRGAASKMLFPARQAPRGEGDLARKTVRMQTPDLLCPGPPPVRRRRGMSSGDRDVLAARYRHLDPGSGTRDSPQRSRCPDRFAFSLPGPARALVARGG
jgi:hypothetical protein